MLSLFWVSVALEVTRGATTSTAPNKRTETLANFALHESYGGCGRPYRKLSG